MLDMADKLLSGQGGLWLRIYGRTLLLAVIVTGVDILLAFPLAWFMARIAPPRWRTLLFLAVVVPLWSSILVRIFAWRTILGSQGLLNSFLVDVGLLQHPSSAFLYNDNAIALTWAYVWLPFMVLPIYTALEKIPTSYLEASRDLGAGSLATFRRVIFPLALPGYVASENPRFMTAVPPKGQTKPKGYSNVAYWCGNNLLFVYVGRECWRSRAASPTA